MQGLPEVARRFWSLRTCPRLVSPCAVEFPLQERQGREHSCEEDASPEHKAATGPENRTNQRRGRRWALGLSVKKGLGRKCTLFFFFFPSSTTVSWHRSAFEPRLTSPSAPSRSQHGKEQKMESREGKGTEGEAKCPKQRSAMGARERVERYRP